MEQQNVEQLLNRVKNLGFSEDVQNEVAKHMNEGRKEFNVIEKIVIGNHEVSYELMFGPGKKGNEGPVYLNEIDMLLEKPKEANTMEADLVRYNKFSPYFNLTALEMYNVLEGRAALKTLFKTNAEKGETVTMDENTAQKAKGEQFTTWVKADFSAGRRPNGAWEMEFAGNNLDLREVLKQYNFEETNDRYARGKVIDFLEKGSQVMVTNLNPNGENKICIEVDPKRGDIKLSKTTGEAISSRDVYLKNNYAIKVGPVVELIKSAASGESLAPNVVRGQAPEVKQEQSAKIGQYREKAIQGASQSEKKSPDKLGAKNDEGVKLRKRNGSRELTDDAVKNGIGR